MNIALSRPECDLWVRGLRFLSRDTLTSSYPLQMERWLWKEFCNMTTDRTTVTLKDVKAFLPQVNCQMTKPRLKEAFHEVDCRRLGELSFDEFASLYHILIYDENVQNAFLPVIKSSFEQHWVMPRRCTSLSSTSIHRTAAYYLWKISKDLWQNKATHQWKPM